VLDSHADTTCIGRNFRVISHTDKVCEVFPYHPGYESIQEAPIVQAAMAYDDPDSGETFILVVNQCLHLGDMMEHTLMNPNQLRANGMIVNDVPVHCEHTSILRALIKYPQGNLEETRQETLQSTQEEPGGRPYRKARTYATGRTRAYSTKRYTVVKLCYVTQAYAT